MIAGSLAKRYARALVEVAAASHELDPVARELGEFAALLRAERQLRLFFANPSIQRRDKVGAYEQIATKLAVRPLTRTFLRVLLEAGRLGELENVLRAYEGLVDERLERVKAVVTSAVPLAAETQERLRQRLQEQLGMSMLYITHSLGVIAEISDNVVVMYLGRIVEYATADAIFHKPLHPYTEALMAAVPRTEPQTISERVPLEGEVPDPANPPPGCPFHPRCPYAVERCRAEVPGLAETVPGRYAACHRASELDLTGVTAR